MKPRPQFRKCLWGLALGLATCLPLGAGTINNEMVVHLPFDNTYANTVNNSVTAEAVGAPSFAAGKVGAGALAFSSMADGSAFNYVTLGMPLELVFDSDGLGGPPASFSVAFWSKLGAWTGDPAFIGNKSWNSGGNIGWVIATAGDGHIQWNFKDGNPRRDYDGPSGLFSDNAWHHIVVTFDRGGNATTYVDGAMVDATPIAPSADSLDPFYPTNIGQDGTGTYTDGGSVGVTDGQIDDVAIWRRVLSGSEVARIYASGLEGINVANVPDPTGVAVSGYVPGVGATGVSPAVVVRLTLEDASTQLDKASVELTYDGQVVAHTLESSGAINVVVFDPPGLLVPQSTHSIKLVFRDNATPPATTTVEYSFTVADYKNIQLPAPLFSENFDAIAEGALPNGWTVENYTGNAVYYEDLDDPDSDSYLNWVVISSNRVVNVGTLGGWNATQRLNVAPNQFVNGQEITSLIENNFIYAESDVRGGSQVQYLFTPSYNLTGKTDVHLYFHSIRTQNQDDIAAVEYSIDGGTSWLPILYMIDRNDIILGTDGLTDAVATLNEPRGDAATYVDPITFETVGGTYGAFIKAPITAELAPYISGRVDDDQFESKRVELYRLPQADNQSNVRFRFAQAGTASWFFGIDNFGLYSISTASPPTATKPADQTAAVGNSATFTTTVSGTEPVTIQWRFNGDDIVGATSATYKIDNVKTTDAGTYTVKVTNVAGTFETQPATLTVITVTADVTGQWDFNNGDLSATVGSPLEYFAAEVETGTQFGTTTSFGVPDIAGAVANVMAVPELNPMGGYIMRHGAAVNGGGAYVNQYTLIMDVLYPQASAGKWLVFLQTSDSNGNDGDFFANTSGGIGISGNYQGKLNPDTWHRVAFAVDLSGPGPSPIVAKFIDGVKVGEQTLGEGRDGRWSLYGAAATPNFALLFADNDGDNALMYVNSVQFRNGRVSDADLAALGGASAAGIPAPSTEGPAVAAAVEGNNLAVSWPGSVTGYALFSAPALTGAAWTQVAGTPQQVGDRWVQTDAIGAGTRFYRLQQQ